MIRGVFKLQTECTIHRTGSRLKIDLCLGKTKQFKKPSARAPGDYCFHVHAYRRNLGSRSVSQPSLTAEHKGTVAELQTFAEVDKIGFT